MEHPVDGGPPEPPACPDLWLHQLPGTPGPLAVVVQLRGADVLKVIPSSHHYQHILAILLIHATGMFLPGSAECRIDLLCGLLPRDAHILPDQVHHALSPREQDLVLSCPDGAVTCSSFLNRESFLTLSAIHRHQLGGPAGVNPSHQEDAVAHDGG